MARKKQQILRALKKDCECLMALEVIARIIDKVPECPCRRSQYGRSRHYYGGGKRCLYCGYEKGIGTLLAREVNRDDLA